MSDAVIDKLATIDLATVIVLIILINTLFNFTQPLVKKLYDAIAKKIKKEHTEIDYKNMIKEDHDKVIEYAQNRIHDREQSFKIQKELTESIKALNERLDKIQEVSDQRHQENMERENKRVRAELKNSISQLYQTYNATKQWTMMQKEALEDLIEEYEAAGGTNSFVHSKVEMEMYSWEVIDHVES